MCHGYILSAFYTCHGWHCLRFTSDCLMTNICQKNKQSCNISKRHQYDKTNCQYWQHSMYGVLNQWWFQEFLNGGRGTTNCKHIKQIEWIILIIQWHGIYMCGPKFTRNRNMVGGWGSPPPPIFFFRKKLKQLTKFWNQWRWYVHSSGLWNNVNESGTAEKTLKSSTLNGAF